MKFGLLCCFYDCADLVQKVIKPWSHLADHIAIVHGQFKEYHDFGYPDEDQKTLDAISSIGCHDYLYIQDGYNKGVYETEAQIRDYGLQWLLTTDSDAVILLDGDEVYTESDINNCFNFVENNPFTTWFSIEFKNLTFTENQYTTGFCPPRVFRTKTSNLKLYNCYWDNDFNYVVGEEGGPRSYRNFSSQMVPNILCNPLHYSWLNNERSRKKIQYQEKHFSNGAGCSFKWGPSGLEWNEDYFRKSGQIKPELHIIS